MAEHCQQIARLVAEHGLRACFECGKCTASCPLYELFDDLTWEASPRGIVEAGLDESDLTEGQAIWFCLSCDACTDGCPCGVAIRDFIEGVRLICLEAGQDEHVVRCRKCDTPFMPGTTLQMLVERTLEQGSEVPELLLHCARCRAREHAARLKRGFGDLPLDGDGFHRNRR